MAFDEIHHIRLDGEYPIRDRIAAAERIDHMCVVNIKQCGSNENDQGQYLWFTTEDIPRYSASVRGALIAAAKQANLDKVYGIKWIEGQL